MSTDFDRQRINGPEESFSVLVDDDEVEANGVPKSPGNRDSIMIYGLTVFPTSTPPPSGGRVYNPTYGLPLLSMTLKWKYVMSD